MFLLKLLFFYSLEKDFLEKSMKKIFQQKKNISIQILILNPSSQFSIQEDPQSAAYITLSLRDILLKAEIEIAMNDEGNKKSMQK